MMFSPRTKRSAKLPGVGPGGGSAASSAGEEPLEATRRNTSPSHGRLRQPGTPILCRQRHPPRPYHRRLCRHPAASLPPARSIRGRDDSSLAEPARFRRFSFSFGFSPTRTSSTASGRCLAFIPAYRHDGRAATRPSRILYVVKRGLEKFPCPDRVPRPSHVETPPITRHIRRCLLKPQRIRRVAMSYRAQMFSRFLPLSVHASRSNLRGALSAKVSLLPPEAFGLVPPLPPYSECITQYQQRSVGGIRSPREQGGSCELAGASGWWSARAATRSRLSAQIKSSLRVFTNSVRAAKSRKISAVFRYSSASVDGGRTLIMSISPR